MEEFVLPGLSFSCACSMPCYHEVRGRWPDQHLHHALGFSACSTLRNLPLFLMDQVQYL